MPQVLLPLQANAWIARARGTGGPERCARAQLEAHWRLCGGREQDGECSGVRGSRTRLYLSPSLSPLCLSPPSIVFFLPLLSFFGTFSLSALLNVYRLF